MTIVRMGITMSADGYVAGPKQSRENPRGERGQAMHQWAFTDGGQLRYDCIRVVCSPAVTHFKYRRVR